MRNERWESAGRRGGAEEDDAREERRRQSERIEHVTAASCFRSTWQAKQNNLSWDGQKTMTKKVAAWYKIKKYQKKRERTWGWDGRQQHNKSITKPPCTQEKKKKRVETQRRLRVESRFIWSCPSRRTDADGKPKTNSWRETLAALFFVRREVSHSFFKNGAKFLKRAFALSSHELIHDALQRMYTHFTASVEKSACCAAGVVGQSEQETPSVLYYTVFRVSSLIRRRASALLPTWTHCAFIKTETK